MCYSNKKQAMVYYFCLDIVIYIVLFKKNKIKRNKPCIKSKNKTEITDIQFSILE